MKKVICLNFLLIFFFNLFTFNVFANETDLDVFFRDDASVYSSEEIEEYNEKAIEEKQENANTNSTNNQQEEKKIEQEIKENHGIREEIVLELEEDIVYEDRNLPKDNVFLTIMISGLLIVFTIILGIFITIKNSKK
jgi:ATP-dependent Zn protease